MPEQPNARPWEKTGTPGIHKKGDRYYDRWKERGKARAESYPTITAAKRGRADRIARGGHGWSRERFDRYARSWVDTYRGRTKRGLDEGTRDEYRTVIENWLIPYFRHTPIGEIGPKSVSDFIEHLVNSDNKAGDPLAAATIRWIMAPLKGMLADAFDRGMVPAEAWRVRIVVPDRVRGKQRPKTMTREQTTAVLDAVPERYRLLFLLLACTGLRISEALGLQWQDLEQSPDGPAFAVRRQFYKGKLKPYPKTEAGDRFVAVVPALARELTRHRAVTEYAAPGDPVFATRVGTHLSAHNVRRMLRPITAELGLEWVTPHVFRHSLATTLAKAGHDANAIARVLGHTDPGFTQRTYIHAPNVVRFDALFAERDEAAVVHPEVHPGAEKGGKS